MALEGIATLSLVCNVMQVIRYGSEAVELVNHIHSMGRSVWITELDTHAARIRSAIDALQASVQRPMEKQGNQHMIDLYEVSQQCLTEAEELRQRIATIPTANSRRGAIGAAWWIMRKRSRINRIRQRLDLCQQDLDTRILVNLSLKIDAQSPQHHHATDFTEQWTELVRELSIEQRKVLESTVQLEGDFTRQVIELGSTDVVEQLERSLSQLKEQQNLSQNHYQTERLLSSLEYASMNARRNQIALPETNTFDWLFRSLQKAQKECSDQKNHSWDPFDAWLETGSGIYWINGKAGSGKSTLMKHIVSNPDVAAALRQWANTTTVIVLSHYFWMAGYQHERSSKGFYLALLHQMLLKLPEALQRLLSEHAHLARKKTYEDWSEAELIEMIQRVEDMFDTRFCLFIDGLDELEESSTQGRTAVLDFIHLQARRANIKCCVSSRPVVALETSFVRCPQMRLQDLTEYDIKAVIDKAFERITPIAASQTDTSILQDMRNELFKKAEGVFLWVSLVLKSLLRGFQNGDSLPTLQRRLELLPSEIEKLYERMWNQLNDDQKVYKEEAAFIFKLVLHREDFWMVNTEEHNSYCRSLCFFAMVINGVDINAALPDFREAAVARIERQSDEMAQMIRTRCAGILEVVGPEDTMVPSLANGDLFHDRLKRFITLEVRFIHRSAYAFLVETKFGESLLAPCPHSRIDIATRIVQCALLFWHTKVTNQGELPYTLHLAERFMVQHARTEAERKGLSDAIAASLEMYKTLSGWSTGEQDGSYLLYQYIDPAVRYHTVDTAGWMLSFATKQIFDEVYRRTDLEINPDFTDYLLLCLASQIHFRVPNPRFHEQSEPLSFLLSHDPRLDTVYYLRYPYPFKKSAALLLTEKLIYDLLEVDHRSEAYELMSLFFAEAARVGCNLSAKFVVLWSLQEMYQSLLMPVERLFVNGIRYSTTMVLEVNLRYLLELILMVCEESAPRIGLKKAVQNLISTSTHAGPQMQVIMISSGGGRCPKGFRDERQRIKDIDDRGWKSLQHQDALSLREIYEQYQVSRPEVKAKTSFGSSPLLVDDRRSLPDMVEDCARRGISQQFFDFLETRGYCKKPDDSDVMHRAPNPYLRDSRAVEEERE